VVATKEKKLNQANKAIPVTRVDMVRAIRVAITLGTEIHLAGNDAVLGVNPGLNRSPWLSTQDIRRLSGNLAVLSKMLHTAMTASGSVDFDLGYVCDCEVTVKCLNSIRVYTLSDFLRQNSTALSVVLGMAEMNFATHRQYHLHALARSALSQEVPSDLRISAMQEAAHDQA
jgi:hypothetical protein